MVIFSDLKDTFLGQESLLEISHHFQIPIQYHDRLKEYNWF